MSVTKGDIHYNVGGGVGFVIDNTVPDYCYVIQDSLGGGDYDLRKWIARLRTTMETGMKLNRESAIIKLNLDSFYHLRDYLFGFITITIEQGASYAFL